jgi:CBS domain-containing protein
MWDRDCGIVPVVDPSRKVVGIVTDRDICIAALTKGRTLSDMAVAEVMRREVFTCRETQSVERIHALLRKHQVRRLPVVGEAGTLVGIVSINDLALAAADETGDARHQAMIEVAETLAAICCHREPVLH